MKIKLFLALLSATLLLLSGCGTAVGTSESQAESQPESQPESTVTTPEATSTPEATDAPEESAPLIVYFSWSGNTDAMAGWVAEETGGTLYRITPAEPYADSFDACADRARSEIDNGISPALIDLPTAEEIAQYDTIYVGFPIWWYDLPRPVYAFLESYDLSGKTIIPFFSHNGSSSGASSLTTLEAVCAGATVLSDSALSIRGSDVENADAEVRAWARDRMEDIL